MKKISEYKGLCDLECWECGGYKVRLFPQRAALENTLTLHAPMPTASSPSSHLALTVEHNQFKGTPTIACLKAFHPCQTLCRAAAVACRRAENAAVCTQAGIDWLPPSLSVLSLSLALPLFLSHTHTNEPASGLSPRDRNGRTQDHTRTQNPKSDGGGGVAAGPIALCMFSSIITVFLSITSCTQLNISLARGKRGA